MSDSPTVSSRGGAIAALFAVLVAAGAGVLYVNGGQSGKKVDGACAAAQSVAAAAKPLAKGEVAAMNIASDPESMPELTFNGPDGKPITLKDFKGKTLLLNLWATWCVPCRAEMPALDRLQKELGSDKFEVVTVNIDTARLERPKAFLDEIGVKSLSFYADPKAAVFQQLKQDGQVMGLPTTFLVDPSGCQIGLMSGPAAWDSADGKALISSVVAHSSGAAK